MSEKEYSPTIREDWRNAKGDVSTAREPASASGGERILANPDDEFHILKSLPARGAEADLFIIFDEDKLKILKLYREGMEPKREMVERYENVSRACPKRIVKIYKTGFNRKTGRWYESQEYIEGGSVADALSRGVKFEFREFVRELSEAVAALHEYGIAHRDLKPANILVRSASPLNLVLADFGVASALDGASARETDRRGLTPMYAAPEDMLGQLVSRRADWWACGMIFYEILLGAHPFKNLSPGRVAYILSTQGVEIDGNLPEDQKSLLAGLLTRNDKARWGWDQVRAWLGGDKNIPVFYEGAGGSNIAPFVFEGRPYNDLRGLALAFASGYEQSRLGKGMLARGSVAKWLQNSNRFDEEAVLSEEIADGDADLYLFKFVRKYAPDTPFALYGLIITPENVLRWLRDGGGEAEKYVLSLFANGEIKKFFPRLPDGLRDPTLEAFAEADWSKDPSLSLAAAIEPDMFFWGIYGAPETAIERIKFAERNPNLLAISAWREMGGEDSVIPPSVANLFRNDKYEDAIARLANLEKRGRTLKIGDFPKKFKNNVYDGSEIEYAREVLRKNPDHPDFQALFREMRAIIDESERNAAMNVEIMGGASVGMNDVLDATLSRLRYSIGRGIENITGTRGPLNDGLDYLLNELSQDVREPLANYLERIIPRSGAGLGFFNRPVVWENLYNLVRPRDARATFYGTIDYIRAALRELYNLNLEFSPEALASAYEYIVSAPDSSETDSGAPLRENLAEPLARALFEADIEAGNYRVANIFADGDHLRLTLEKDRRE